MGILITVEHCCPLSTCDNRPYLDTECGRWTLPLDEYPYTIKFCPFCGDLLETPHSAELARAIKGAL